MRNQALIPADGESYTRWVERFLRFHRDTVGKWIHPQDMTAAHVESFVTYLAVSRHVAASTQNQALNALVFLFRDVVNREIGEFNAVRAKRPIRLPTVLSQDGVQRVLGTMELGNMHGLMARLLYGSGLRLMESCTLRIMDADLDRGQIVVGSGKGNKDRITMLPISLREPIYTQIERVAQQHRGDLQGGRGWVKARPRSSTSTRLRQGNLAGSSCFRLTGASWMKSSGAGRDGTSIRARSRVQIYDLSGRLVSEDAALGSELDWHTDSLSGDYLANGIYLYRVQVRIGGSWINQDIGKIAVLR